jgi:hypothetical protein
VSIDAPDLNGHELEEAPVASVVITAKGTIDGNAVVVQATTYRDVPINQAGKVPTGALKTITDQEVPFVPPDTDEPLPNVDNLALAERLEKFAATLRRLHTDSPDLPPIMSFGATPSEVWFQPWLPCAPVTALAKWETEFSDRPDRRAVVLWPGRDDLCD